jgi:hypothetical protein
VLLTKPPVIQSTKDVEDVLQVKENAFLGGPVPAAPDVQSTIVSSPEKQKPKLEINPDAKT